jgi:hypothetical protein
VLLPQLSSTWLPPGTLTVLMLHLQTSHVHCTRMLTAVLVLQFFLQLCRLSRAFCTSGQLHTILHFTAAAPATTVDQLFVSSHGHCTSKIISCSIHCFCYCCGLCSPGSLDLATNCLHTLADHQQQERAQVDLLDRLSCQRLHRHQVRMLHHPCTSAAV